MLCSIFESGIEQIHGNIFLEYIRNYINISKKHSDDVKSYKKYIK